MNFEFATPTRIIFGEGRVSEAAPLAASMCARVLVVEGGSSRAEPLMQQLREHGVAVTTLVVDSEPVIGALRCRPPMPPWYAASPNEYTDPFAVTTQ